MKKNEPIYASFHHLRRQIRKSQWIIILLIIARCGGAPPSITELDLTESEINHAIEQGPYLDIAWVSENQVALLTEKGIATVDVEVVNRETGEKQTMSFGQLDSCPKPWIPTIDRGDEGQLLFIHECRDEELRWDKTELLSWDMPKNELTLLYTYPLYFHPRDFAISADKTWLLHETKGTGIFTGLHAISLPDDEPMTLFYSGAGSPAIHDETILFAATDTKSLVMQPFKSLTERLEDSSVGSPGWRSRASQKWRIYSTDSKWTTFDPILEDIKLLDNLHISPKGNLISFRGSVQNTLGVWLMDLSSSQLYLLFRTDETEHLKHPHAWSPDGNKIAILTCQQGEAETTNSFGELICEVNIFDLSQVTDNVLE